MEGTGHNPIDPVTHRQENTAEHTLYMLDGTGSINRRTHYITIANRLHRKHKLKTTEGTQET